MRAVNGPSMPSRRNSTASTPCMSASAKSTSITASSSSTTLLGSRVSAPRGIDGGLAGGGARSTRCRPSSAPEAGAQLGPPRSIAWPASKARQDAKASPLPMHATTVPRGTTAPRQTSSDTGSDSGAPRHCSSAAPCATIVHDGAAWHATAPAHHAAAHIASVRHPLAPPMGRMMTSRLDAPLTRLRPRPSRRAAARAPSSPVRP